MGAVDGDTLTWSAEAVRHLLQQLREHASDLDPFIVPEALRPNLSSLNNEDLSDIPGGDMAPYGFEYILFVVQTHAPHAQAIDHFPTVIVRCEMTLVETRGPEILANDAFSHYGKGKTEGEALEQAFGRCIEDSVMSFENKP